MTEVAKLELFTLSDSQDGPTLARLVSLTLNPGDVLVMRGDTIHAGAGYVRGHFGRLHAYLDHPMVKRDLDSTDRKLPQLKSATRVVGRKVSTKVSSGRAKRKARK